MVSPVLSETVPCCICGEPHHSLGTGCCDRCWELESRINAAPELAYKILTRGLRGVPIPKGTYVKQLTGATWDKEFGCYTCLAQVESALCIVECSNVLDSSDR